MEGEAAVIGAIQEGLTQLQTSITTAIAEAARTIQNPPILAPALFIRFRLQANQARVLDLSTKDNKKYYEIAMRSLFLDKEKFDVEPAKFQTFMNLLFQQLKDLGMFANGMNCMIPTPWSDGVNMVSDYGRITMAQVSSYVQTWLTGQNRRTQNSKILFDLLTNSLSTEGLQRVQLWRSQYEIEGLVSGECYLKVIIHKSYLDSNATVSTLRLNLTNLDEYITNNGTDLVAFNAYVQSQVDGLTARGETTNDLVVNLFKGYKAVKDKSFLDYLQMIENAHEDGSTIMDAPTLMLKASNFYKNKLTRKEWEQLTTQEKDVLALKAKVGQLERNTKRVRQVQFDRGTKGGTNDTKASTAGKKTPKPTWIKDSLPPSKDKLYKYQTWNNAKWYWCVDETGGKCGGKWRTHMPSKCQGKSHMAQVEEKERSFQKEGGNKNKHSRQKQKSDALQMEVAHQALVQDTTFSQEDDMTDMHSQDSEYESS